MEELQLLNENLTISSSKIISADNGYIIIGNYSLRIESQGSIQTLNGYDIW